MPGPATHFIALNETIKKLKSSNNQDLKNFANIMEQKPAFAHLGSIGPDLAYFIGSGPRFVRALNDIFSFIKNIKELFGMAADVTNSIGMPNLSNRIEDFERAYESATVTLETVFLTSLLKVIEIFMGNMFKNGEKQKNKPPKDWGWGEILHSLLTGKVAEKLLDTARRSGKDEWLAYALGYVTHIATDVAGHPYVNQITGGPARAFGMRHHLCENFIDTQVWWNVYQKEVAGAKLHKKIKGVEDSGRLRDFSEMLSKILTDFYNQSRGTAQELPDPPKTDDIEAAFKNLLGTLQLISDTLFLDPPQPPGIEIPPLPGQEGSLTGVVIDALDALTDDPSFWDILLAILLAVFLLFTIAADLVRIIADLAIGIGTYPIAAATWLLEMAIFYIYRFLLQLLVVSGVLYPFHDELVGGLGIQFSMSYIPEPTYPHQPEPIEQATYIVQLITRVISLTLSDYHYLSYPITRTERPPTLSSPYANVTPLYFIKNAFPNDQYRNNSLNAPKPHILNQLNEILRSQMFGPPTVTSIDKAFGSAVDIGVDLMKGSLPLINYDLDADRGYTYRCWKFSGGLPDEVNNADWI